MTSPARSSSISSTGSRKATPKPNMNWVTKLEIIADAGQRLLLDAAEIALEAEQEMERDRHREIIGQRGAGQEQERRQQQEGQEARAFPSR